jgi:hypothetical protein
LAGSAFSALTDSPKSQGSTPGYAGLEHHKALILAKNVLYIDLSYEYENRRARMPLPRLGALFFAVHPKGQSEGVKFHA